MVVYKTTNLINGKMYIGRDAANSPHYLGSGKYLKAAIKKYGKNNFIKEILCYCSSNEELNEKEQFYIALYNSTDKAIGYNLTKGGAGLLGYKRTPEMIRKWRKKMTGPNNPSYGKKVPEEVIRKGVLTRQAKMDEIRIKLSLSHMGIKPTKKTRKKMSDSHKGKVFSPKHRGNLQIAAEKRGRKIQEYDPKTGVTLFQWNSIASAVRETGIKNIAKVLCGERRSAGNRHFRYAI